MARSSSRDALELALVGEIVDRHHGRGLAASPAQVAGGERGRPVVEMEDVGPPAVQAAHRQFGGGEAQPREADRVVGELIAGGVGVRRAVAVVEFGAQDEIDDEPVRQGQRADRAGRDRAGARQMGDDVDRRYVAQRRTIGGQQHARVATGAQRARQRGRDFAKTARLEKVGGLRGDEQRLGRDVGPRRRRRRTVDLAQESDEVGGGLNGHGLSQRQLRRKLKRNRKNRVNDRLLDVRENDASAGMIASQ